MVHSVIIGVSLGASQSAETVKPLLAALSFHQFFEGLGLGGCISQVPTYYHLFYYYSPGFFSIENGSKNILPSHGNI